MLKSAKKNCQWINLFNTIVCFYNSQIPNLMYLLKEVRLTLISLFNFKDLKMIRHKQNTNLIEKSFEILRNSIVAVFCLWNENDPLSTSLLVLFYNNIHSLFIKCVSLLSFYYY